MYFAFEQDPIEKFKLAAIAMRHGLDVITEKVKGSETTTSNKEEDFYQSLREDS